MGYNKIRLFPSIKYDYLIFLRNIASNAEIEKHYDSEYIPDWDDFSEPGIIAQFTNDLNSSIVSGLIDPAIGWLVYRRKVNETRSHLVAELPALQFFVKDYVVADQTQYIYDIVVLTENEMGVSIRSNPIKTDWLNYSITSIKQIGENMYQPSQVWLFDLNLTSTDIAQNIDITTYNTFTKYPKVSKGESNYQTMGITALVGGMKCVGQEYREPIELLEAWQEFVATSDLCIWKDYKGAMKLGQISDGSSSKYVDGVIGNQPTHITFNFIETQDISNIRVYSFEEKFYNMQKTIDKEIHIKEGFD